MVKGLDTFAAFFAGDEARYVLIGGVATQLVREEAGLPARATKDLDIVLCVEALDVAFGEKLWTFIRNGGYQVRQEGVQGRCFYRFAKPGNPAYPHMLEFFAREPGRIPLADGARLTPVPFDKQVESLSAILLDRDYYDFLHAHTRQLAGVHLGRRRALRHERRPGGDDGVAAEPRHRGNAWRLAGSPAQKLWRRRVTTRARIATWRHARHCGARSAPRRISNLPPDQPGGVDRWRLPAGRFWG